jgi:nickel-dependent lactate racemase
MAIVHYGKNLSLELDIPEGVAIDELGEARGEPLADLGLAVKAALANPIDYPPLVQCFTPTDRVVLAIDRGLPQAAQAVTAVIEVLMEAGVDPQGVSVLLPHPEHGVQMDNPCRLLPSELREQITVLTHDPEDRRQLAYLAANVAGEAILIHRALHEADVVLPIGCIRSEDTSGYFGIHNVVFPVFSDTKTFQRLRSSGLTEKKEDFRKAKAEVNHAAWALGVLFTIQFVPGAGDQVLHVLAGESEAVRHRGYDLYCESWRRPLKHRAAMVIAGIEGDASQQTWEHIGRTLEVAGELIEDDGALVICSDLAIGPGPALRQLNRPCSCHEPGHHHHHHKTETAPDALPAAQLARALEKGKVYLLSRLEPSVVEELNVVPIAGTQELNRLLHQHDSCILLSNALRVMIE